MNRLDPSHPDFAAMVVVAGIVVAGCWIAHRIKLMDDVKKAVSPLPRGGTGTEIHRPLSEGKCKKNLNPPLPPGSPRPPRPGGSGPKNMAGPQIGGVDRCPHCGRPY